MPAKIKHEPDPTEVGITQGDVVKLRSGSDQMTVESFDAYEGFSTVRTVWWSAGQPQSGQFYLFTLRRA